MMFKLNTLALLCAAALSPSALAQVSVKVGDTAVKVDVGDTHVDVGTAPAAPAKAKAKAETALVAPSTKPTSITIEGAGVTQEVTCEKDGIQRIEITAASATVTVKGECGELDITGASNTVTVDYVKKITITGTSNLVSYKSAAPEPKKAKKAKIKNTGVGNKIELIKAS